MVVNTVNLIEPRITHDNKPLGTPMRAFLNPGNLNGKTHKSKGGVPIGGLDRRKIKEKALHFPIHLLSCLLMTRLQLHCFYHRLLISDQDFPIFQKRLHTSGSPRALQVFVITLVLIRHPVSWAEQQLGSQALQHEDSNVILLICTV